MQTTDFVRGLREMVTQLKVVELHSVIAPIVKREGNPPIPDESKRVFSELLFDSRTGYDKLNGDPVTARLIVSLKMAEVYDRSRLGKLVTIYNNSSSLAAIYQTQENFAQFATFFSLLEELITFAQACTDLLGAERVMDPPHTRGALELEVIDYDGTGIELTRLQDIFSALSRIHESVMRALGNTDSRLKIRFLDSGTDIRISLEGAKEVIDSIRRLLKEFWLAVRFRKFDEFDRKIETLSKSLVFASTVQKQVENGTIDQPTGDVLKAAVLDQATKLVGLGAILAGSEAGELVDTRKLLTEKRGIKLLGAGDSGQGN
jgi:hypothetical protein